MSGASPLVRGAEVPRGAVELASSSDERMDDDGSANYSPGTVLKVIGAAEPVCFGAEPAGECFESEAKSCWLLFPCKVLWVSFSVEFMGYLLMCCFVSDLDVDFQSEVADNAPDESMDVSDDDVQFLGYEKKKDTPFGEFNFL